MDKVVEVKTRNVAFLTEAQRFRREMFYKTTDGLTEDKVDGLKYYDKFIGTAVTSHQTIDDNANVVDTSVISYYSEAPKAMFKKAAYDYIRNQIGVQHYTAIKEGNLYVCDLTRWFSSYCYSYSLQPLVFEGMPFIVGLKVKPPKHAQSFIDILIQTTAYISNSQAGAVSYGDLFIYLDWYLRNDYGVNYYAEATEEVEQLFQKLVYSFNFPFRASQSAFVNLTIYDKYFMKDLFSHVTYPDGSKVDLKGVNKLQQWFSEHFIKMNETEQLLTFPVLTASMYKKEDKIQDEEFLNWLSEVNYKRGTFNIYTGDIGNLSSCCRLISDTKLFSSTLGNPSISVGSTRVVVLNLVMAALEARDDVDFFNKLKHTYDLAVDILVAHRRMLEVAVSAGKHPLYSKGWASLDRQFCTIGFVGLNEAIEVLGSDIVTKEGTELAAKILNTINKWNTDTHTFTKVMFNLEQVPAESLGVTLANKTNFKFNTKYEILSNQYLPLSVNADIKDRIKVQGKLDKLTQGGGILHINLDETLTSAKQMKRLIEYSAKQGVIYQAINYGISRCTKCGENVVGIFKTSPCCDAQVEIWERIVGYLRPRSVWGKARQKEAGQRKRYKQNEVD